MAPRKRQKSSSSNKFHMEFKNTAQKLAWAAFQQHDVLFLTGPAGVGKTHLAMAFAISELLQKNCKRIILTRPIVESGENLGFLPGDFQEKVDPYMSPLYDVLGKLVGYQGPQREEVEKCIEVAPIAYMRGRTFDDSICIFDESQNATKGQLTLFMSRFGENSKLIITGDPMQSDIGNRTGLVDVMTRLETLKGIGIIRFKNDNIVRHPLVGQILDKLSE
jgi:phosphate starvation-inducible protein PhoH and related proteins